MYSISNLISKSMQLNRIRTAIEIPGRTKMTYEDVNVLSNKIVNLLLSLNLTPQARILVQVTKSPEAICLYIAALRSGYIYLPVNTSYTRSELVHFVADSQPEVIIADPKNMKNIQSIVKDIKMTADIFYLDEYGQGSLINNAMHQSSTEPKFMPKPDDTAAILYTSGTTGSPKGVMLTQNNLASNALALNKIWEFTSNDILLHALPTFHAHGLFVACNCVLTSGSQMIFLPKFDIQQVIYHLSRASVFMGIPTFYSRLLSDSKFTKESCKSVRLFTSGSAPLTDELFLQFQKKTGHTIVERYGTTETIILTSNSLHGSQKPGSVGKPLPEVIIRIMKKCGKSISHGEIGQIEAKGPNVFIGYYNLPKDTADAFTTDGYFQTGDLGTYDSNGDIKIVGRSKDMIISGGYNVYPKEIETVLNSIPGVSESAVFGVPHPDFGEGVVAAVVLSQQDSSISPNELINFVKQHLAFYKVPKHIVLYEKLPRNSMGKILKSELRADQTTLFQ